MTNNTNKRVRLTNPNKEMLSGVMTAIGNNTLVAYFDDIETDIKSISCLINENSNFKIKIYWILRKGGTNLIQFKDTSEPKCYPQSVWESSLENGTREHKIYTIEINSFNGNKHVEFKNVPSRIFKLALKRYYR